MVSILSLTLPGWDSNAGLSIGDTVPLQLTLKGTIPADYCHDISHVCVHIIAGNSSRPLAYFEKNFDNDVACFALDQLHCRPGMCAVCLGVMEIRETISLA